VKPAQFETDAATLAVFCPKALAHRMRQPRMWWRENQSVLDVPEVLEGKLALFPIGTEGKFSARLSLDGVLSEGEQKLLVGHVGKLGVHLDGGGRLLRGRRAAPRRRSRRADRQHPDTGAYWTAPPGDYDVTVHVLDWRTNRDFFNEDGEPLPSAPPDFVVVLAKRDGPFEAPVEIQALFDLLPRAEASAESLRVPKVVRRAISVSPRPGRSGISHEPVEVVEEPPAPPAFGLLEPPLLRRAFRDVVEAHEIKDPTDPLRPAPHEAARPLAAAEGRSRRRLPRKAHAGCGTRCASSSRR